MGAADDARHRAGRLDRLVLRLDEQARTVDAGVTDFKTMEVGPDFETRLDSTDLGLQVQLYARAAADVPDANPRTGPSVSCTTASGSRSPSTKTRSRPPPRTWSGRRNASSPITARCDRTRTSAEKAIGGSSASRHARTSPPRGAASAAPRPVFARPERSAR